MSKHVVKDGYSVCLGFCDAGWYGGALVLEGRDAAFAAVPKELPRDQRAAYARRWAALTVGRPRQVALLEPDGDGLATRLLAAAERVEGPVAPRESVGHPVLAWIERRAGQWHLVLFRDGALATVLSRNTIIRCPAVAAVGGDLLFAFERDIGPATTQVEVVDRRGRTRYRAAGRAPLLCAAGEGFVLGAEQATPDEVGLRLEYFTAAAAADPAKTVELREEHLLLNADIAWSPEEQALLVAAERSPRLGFSCQIGLHRTVPAWRWDLASEPVALGELPVEQRAFKSIGAENMAPIKPFALWDAGVPVVVFKQHRFTGFRAFGWDLFLCRREGDGWTEPARISPATTTSDATFGLLCRDGGYVGLFPAHENEGGKGSKQSADHRIEVVTFDRDHRLERFEVPAAKRAEYRVPVSYERIAPEPPRLAGPYEGRQLIWGDLHLHSIYSKCVAAVDGDPRENIRYARDVLGCRVFAIAEHTSHTTGCESAWLFDRLESTVGRDNVVLYASEPGCPGMRDTNWYSRDRETFERLERILLAQGRDFHASLRQVREDLPNDSVFVLRHFHGDAIPDARILQHFDPHFEMAMEAMQGRGNAMLEEREHAGVFPNSFLSAGCKVGLVGGTDHFREWAPNHFCLTGFWVKEVSADGVWEAIRNRHTTAMSDARVALATTCKGLPMGAEVALAADEPLRVEVRASCARSIRRVTLLRDGELLPWTEVNATTAELELVDEDAAPGRHWYVVTAEVETAYGDHTGICHASPYFVWKRSS